MTDVTSNTSWTAVCQTSDILPFSGVCALVNDTQIAIFRTKDDQLWAINNFDPFSDANVLSRGIVGDLEGKLVVASPIFKQHFDLETGQCLEDDSVQLQTFSVRNNDGQVELAL
ncbi:MAG: nitrite reductase small subunit NirD [Pseudomonadales bacterium]|nr:nitrite reductase small subunit NirD [Pseudomonadales bacterium]